MYLRFASICLLFSIFFFQSQGDLFRKHYEAANAAHRAGNYAAAEAEFKAILGEAYERLGRIYSAEGKYQASIEAFESANTTRPASTDALIDLSIAYFHVNQFPKGVEPLQRAIAADARNAIAHHMLGKTWFMMGEFEKATRELQETLRLTPNEYGAGHSLGVCFLKRKDEGQANN